MTNKELIKEAFKAREKSYSPYSKYRVGACLETADGKIYHGCNIENITFTPTICAERTAFFKAVSEGVDNFTRIAIVGGVEDGENLVGYSYPCGVCRQVMVEFCDVDNFIVIVAKSLDEYEEYKLSDLIPHSIGKHNQKLGC